MEGTSSYGAGLARHLKAAGISVMEIERPKRRHLRRKGKSDPIDAEAAARTVLAGEAVGEPKERRGQGGDEIRVLRSARQSALKARSQAANQLQALLVAAPEDLKHRLRQLPTKERPSKGRDGVPLRDAVPSSRSVLGRAGSFRS
jgi:transposase